MTLTEFDQALAKLRQLQAQYAREAAKTAVMIAQAKRDGYTPN